MLYGTMFNILSKKLMLHIIIGEKNTNTLIAAFLLVDKHLNVA